ncbi:MAG: hypothetical protein ACI379_05945 [Nocardioides sp.]|uniref:hypothetical protein n=1 Tax=Nocardioides sp. TaxID=35761 RepID=UPI003F0B1691
MSDRPHHRPLRRSNEFFADLDTGGDPALLREAGDLAATLLVRGAHEGHDAATAERVLHLADTEGLEVLAEVWAGAPADTLAGCLWRLYALRAWVHADPDRAAAEFEAGRAGANVATVLAGVADPPGPDELRAMIDEVLRGIGGDFAVTLFRASAFARIVATGRARTGGSDHLDDRLDEWGHGDARLSVRMLSLAEQLEAAGHQELRGSLA